MAFLQICIKSFCTPISYTDNAQLMSEVAFCDVLTFRQFGNIFSCMDCGRKLYRLDCITQTTR